MADSERPESTAIFEDILDVVGPIGPFQILLLICTTLAELTVCSALYFYILEDINPGYECTKVPVDPNDNFTIVYNTTKNFCSNDEYECVNITFNKPITSLVTDFNLICGRAYILQTTASIFFVGVLIGVFLAPLSDRFGRKRLLIVCWVLMGIFFASLSAVNSWIEYVILKFFMGVFSGVTGIASSVLTVDYLGIKWRRLQAGHLGWGFGLTYMAFLAYFLPERRSLSLAAGIIAIVEAAIFFFIIPESARWLIQRRQYDEAMVQLKRVAKINRRNPPTRELIEAVGHDEMIPLSVLDMFKTKEVAKITLVQIMIWFTNTLMNFGLASRLSDLTNSLYLNMALSGIFCTTVRLSSFYFLEKLGRRYCLSLFGSLTILSCMVIMILDFLGLEAADVRSVTTVTGNAIIGGMWNTVSLYLSETYPTLIRGTARSVMNASTRIAFVVAPLLSLLGGVNKGIPFLLYSVLGIIATVLMFVVMPETQGKPLIESLEVNGMTSVENTYTGYDKPEEDSSEDEVHFDIRK